MLVDSLLIVLPVVDQSRNRLLHFLSCLIPNFYEIVVFAIFK